MALSITLFPITDQKQDPGWHLEPGKPSRGWLSSHAYRCDPLLDANRSVQSIVLDAAIDAEWNGGPEQNDVVVHSGPASPKFGLGSITFGQPWIWRTPRDRALLLGPVPNAEIGPWRMMDAWIDSSKLWYPWFPTLRLLQPGRHLIPEGSVIGSVREVIAWRGAPETAEEIPDEAARVRQTRLGAVRTQLNAAGDPGNLQWRQMAKRKTSIRREGPWRDVLTARRWLAPAVCERLISEFTPSDSKWRDNVDLWWPDLDSWPDVADALDDIGDAIEAATHLPVKISNPHVVKWGPGESMPVHIDVGGRNEFPNRRWASVIYLKTLDSGDTLFPQYDLRIRPKQGKMVAWPGGHTPHEVEPADKERYTLICWWGPA